MTDQAPADAQPADAQPLLVTTDDAGITTIRFNRPETLNALSKEVALGLLDALRTAQTDGSRAIVLTGGDRAFSSGADLQAKRDSAQTGSILTEINQIMVLLRDSAVPTIAAVSGAAAGVGCSLALACDYVIMNEKSFLMLAFTKIGLMPDGGASALVAASAGRHRAMRMALTAERVYGERAFEWGLASELVSEQTPLERAAEVAASFAAGPPLSLAATRRAVNAETLGTLQNVLDRETVGQGMLLSSEDYVEGTTAFREKRAATFTGR
ncbi:enoyl-CoA hydratase-related protein [Brevibacterium sp.]|uniref:enoyl-CoA hydratase-related protein n=1 Tax=Brevibacterium sp. TaxID=1701 RepID=UPI0025BA1DE1|nr:enoyl-CoA hydratase-related protein [Brevibacterium sp.]